MLMPLIAHSGFAPQFEAVVSVDEVRRYKTDPAVYRRVIERLSVAPERVAMISSNCWDAIGSKRFGFLAVWVNRSGAPVDRHGPAPDVELRSLEELPGLLAVNS